MSIHATTILSTGMAIVVGAALVYYLFRIEDPPQEPKLPIPTEGGLNLEKEEREMFVPTSQWQPVGDHHICPAGLEYKININEGTKYARLA
jgi:hypothetical protein